MDIIIAAIAGFVSFISPCVLPLVPAYISYMGGRVTNTVSARIAAGEVHTKPSLSMRFSTFLHGLAFVGGFTFIFVVLGLLGTAFVREVGGQNINTIEGLIGRIGGMLIIAFGLHFMGVIPSFFAWLRQHGEDILSNVMTSVLIALLGVILLSWGFTGTINLLNTGAYEMWAGALAMITIVALLVSMFINGAFTQPGAFWHKTLNTIDYMFYADTRRHMTANGSKGLSSSAIMGVVFAAGWTPCIGPTLGLAMTMAANGGDLGRAAILMTAYSLGLGIPFLLTALMLDSAVSTLTRLKHYMGAIKTVSGAFLVLVGVFIASGSLQEMSGRFNAQFGDVSLRVEHCTIGVFEGEIYMNQYVSCMTGEQDFDDIKEANEAEKQAAIDDEFENTLVVGLNIGDIAPDFQTMSVDGDLMSLSDYRGQVVLVNFWYTYCAPCRHEMPAFESVYQEYSDQGLVVLAVNREEDSETILDFSTELGLSFPLLLDEDSDIQYQYAIAGYPSTYIIDANGVIIARPVGALTKEQIRELLHANDLVSEMM